MSWSINFRWQRLGLWVSPLLLVLAWYVVARLELFSPLIVVPPWRVIETVEVMVADGELLHHLNASLRRLGIGYLLGATIGILFGVALGWIRLVEDFLGPIFHAIRQVPTIALLPVFVLLFGVEEMFKIAIITKAAMFTVALAAYDGTKSIPRQYFDVARVYALPPLVLFSRLILPAILPSMLTGLRIALSRSWTILVAAEIVAAESGLGHMMENARQTFRLDVVMVGVLLTGIIGYALDRLFKLGERHAIRWQPR